MDHIAAAEERLFNERLRQKLNEVNAAAQSHLTSVQDHINFTLQQAYFKCAYECFDRRRKQDEISNCVEHCSVPVLNAQNLVENEMAKFQEKLNRSLRVCQDKYEGAKLQPNSKNAMNDLESCVNLSVQDSIEMMPHLAGKLKAYLSIKD
ncbi:protein FAM136A [Sesamum indicum]|uniref:Protein FAM136A n=1 Tax=Sesamum indicum TaxID=4182 RepID=A0A6I9SUV0_SESIN|nr:protein FAM136A [Sesamum indicum]